MHDHTIHYLEPLSWRAESHTAYVRIHLWQQAKREPMRVDVLISYAELRAILAEVETRREEEAQEKMF